MEFTSSLQNGIDDYKPSLFGQPEPLPSVASSFADFVIKELLSEQQLAALIPPSLRYLLALATHRRPRYLLKILNSFDEIYALLSLAVESHFLRTYGGSLTENFYGLKRERALRIRGGELPRARVGAPNEVRETLKIKNSDVWKNLAILVGLPYLKRKLDEGFEIHGATQSAVMRMGPNYRRDELPLNPTLRQRTLYFYKWFLRKVYPSLNAMCYLLLLAFNLGYLFDGTKFSSPFLWLVGTRIRRLSVADHRAIALANQASGQSTRSRGGSTDSRSRASSSIFNLTSLFPLILPRLLSSLKLLLPTSIFALKFLEWWHASDFARQVSRKAIEDMDLPPPIISGSSPSVNMEPITGPVTKEKTSVSSSKITALKLRNTVALSTDAPSTSDSGTDTSAVSTQLTSIDSRQSGPRLAKIHPISSSSLLPIHTIPAPVSNTSGLCPICRHPIQTPTSAQTGYVFCYVCIFKWMEGTHEKQLAFMSGTSLGTEWDEDGSDERSDASENAGNRGTSREGKWESGKGRCAVTGHRVLGGTDGLRRVMI